MTTEKYNEYLNKYNANYEEAYTSFFEYGVDMFSVLGTWAGLGLKTNGYDKGNAYITELLDEDGNVVGHYRAVPGGIHWELPELIMQLKRYEEEIEEEVEMEE